MLLRRRSSGQGEAEQVEGPHALVDAETGLGNHRQLTGILRREIARSMRYGDRSAIAVIDVRVTGFKPANPRAQPPSPAPFVAQVLLDAARDADVVGRLNLTYFVVLLTESDYEGAQKFAGRVRTAIGSSPYARNDDQSGIYARAWAGCAAWNAAIGDPAAYVQAALDDLEAGRPHYEAEQSWFGGRPGG